nr:autotransporter domain-containing protein [uncultured Gellertiella sp.]
MPGEAPAITSISPASGPAGGGTQVTIVGTSLDEATSVTIGGKQAPILDYDSKTGLTVITPDHAEGAVDVAVTNVVGTGTRAHGFTHVKQLVTPEEVARVETGIHDYVQQRLQLLAENVEVPGLFERGQRAQATPPLTTDITPSVSGATFGYSTSLGQIEAAGNGGGAATPLPVDFWTAGKVLLTRAADGADGKPQEKWGTFALFSAGVDYLVSDRLLVGFSVHYDHESDPLDQGTLITGNGWLAGPYASLQLAPHVFFDTSLLYGQSANSFTSTSLKGDFDTTRWLWSGTLKGDMAFDNGVSLTPRLKAVYLAEKAGAYSAEDKDGNAYPLDAFTERQIRLSIGAEIRKQYELANGVVLTPSLDAEAGFAGLDGGGAFGTLTAGLEADTPDNWQFYAGLLLDLSADGTLATGAKATAGKQF